MELQKFPEVHTLVYRPANLKFWIVSLLLCHFHNKRKLNQYIMIYTKVLKAPAKPGCSAGIFLFLFFKHGIFLLYERGNMKVPFNIF